MRIEQHRWAPRTGWERTHYTEDSSEAQLVLVFGANERLSDGWLPPLRSLYPAAKIIGCSTAGEIQGERAFDATICATAIHFRHSWVHGASTLERDSFAAGQQLARAIPHDGLVHTLVFADGQRTNGSRLVEGLRSCLPSGVNVTGGLAGDGHHFKRTQVFYDSTPESGRSALIGLYGSRLKVGYGSRGGWDPFGPERLITRAKANILYELDGKSALQLYKKYLGESAAELPSSALLFPLSIRLENGRTNIVRTILQISAQEQSMTFAGDLPEGAFARLMKANIERLLDGATEAATTSTPADSPALALLISCVGRKLVLKQRTDEEIERVREVVGSGACLTGFYSYGEISPFQPNGHCELHNQTMSITTLRES